MGQVRVLPDHLANQIAAGEVVERPASALKELIENSLDAGADEIRVILEAGGKKRIRVEDNGSGMDRDDCLMAMERHATSKLTRAEDLFSIRSLGFRGEALPSIASVSRFTLESRPEEADAGVRIQLNGAKIVKVEEVARNRGTTVTVDNLFFNIPARKKFLRKTETELSWMVNLITQYSIANRDKHFFLEHNGKVLLDTTPVKTLDERIYQHYGKSMLERLIPVSTTADWLAISGLVSTPDYFKTSRGFQHLFVNGRMVKDKVLNHAIREAYEGFGEGRLYPVVFLFLELPSTEVDVNVHPAKTEIKFVNSGFVHHTVRNAIRERLVARKVTIPYRFRQGYHGHPSQTASRSTDPWSKPREQQVALPGQGPENTSPLFNQQSQSDNTPYARFKANQHHAESREPAAPRYGSEAAAVAGGQNQAEPAALPTVDLAAETTEGLFRNDPALSRPNVIGQFRDSFIIAEQEGDLLLIDQHVAHERILYDKISAELARGQIERQPLLVPITVELTPQQAVELEHLLPYVRQFGFDLDAFDGNTYIIRETPVFLEGQDVARVVVELLEKAQGQRNETVLESMTDHFAATKACKAAIKIRMNLTVEKMNHLIDTLWANATPLFCPHGRPIILRFRNEEIEKNFLRR